jgi:hypothetical protein
MDHRSYVLWVVWTTGHMCYGLRLNYARGVVIWYTYMDGGWGLAPALSTPKPKHIAIQIITKLYSGKNHWVARRLGGPSQGHTPARRSRGRVLPTTQVLTNVRVTRGDPCLGHVSPIHSPPCHVSRNDSSTNCHLSTNSTLPHVNVWPCQLQPCHISRTTLPRQHPYGLYSQHIFFCLFDDLNRTRYLTHPTSV